MQQKIFEIQNAIKEIKSKCKNDIPKLKNEIEKYLTLKIREAIYSFIYSNLGDIKKSFPNFPSTIFINDINVSIKFDTFDPNGKVFALKINDIYVKNFNLKELKEPLKSKLDEIIQLTIFLILDNF